MNSFAYNQIFTGKKFKKIKKKKTSAGFCHLVRGWRRRKRSEQ